MNRLKRTTATEMAAEGIAPHATSEESREAAALLESAASGDGLAFEELHARYGSRMVAWALSRSRSHEDAEEAAQDAWVSLWRMLPKLRAEGTVNAIGLLVTLAHHGACALHHARHALKRGG